MNIHFKRKFFFSWCKYEYFSNCTWNEFILFQVNSVLLNNPGKRNRRKSSGNNKKNITISVTLWCSRTNIYPYLARNSTFNPLFHLFWSKHYLSPWLRDGTFPFDNQNDRMIFLSSFCYSPHTYIILEMLRQANRSLSFPRTSHHLVPPFFPSVPWLVDYRMLVTWLFLLSSACFLNLFKRKMIVVTCEMRG